MKKWKTRIFGDNQLNFYGWSIGGLIVMGASVWFVLHAIRAGAGNTGGGALLVGIYFLLLGHFGLGLHNYAARVAQKLDADDKEGDEAESRYVEKP
jgi:hypothetical protein